MKFIIDNWWLILIALSSGSLLIWPVIQGASATGVSAAGAVQLINREKAVVIDVGDTPEFAAGHVGGAKSVPLAELEARLPVVVKNKSLPLILVCANGARANKALAIAKKLGFDNAQVLGGGMGAWKTANLPVEKS